jgi:hypothetical protein
VVRRVAPEGPAAGGGIQHATGSSRSTGRRSAIWRIFIARCRGGPLAIVPRMSLGLSRRQARIAFSTKWSRASEIRRCPSFNVVTRGAASLSL